MATQAKRKLKAPATPKQARNHKQAPTTAPNGPIEHPNEQIPLPPPHEKHRNAAEPTSKTSTSIRDAPDGTPDQSLPDDEEEEADPDDSKAAGGSSPKSKLKLAATHPHKRPHLRKTHSSSPFPSARSPALHLDDSDDDVFSNNSKRSRHTSLALAAHSSPLREPRRSRSKAVDSDTDFDIDMSEAIWGHQADQPQGVMITWAGDSDHEGSDHTSDGLEIQIKEKDLEELLAWGNGEVSIPGMPEVVHSDFWPQHGPFFELDSSSSNDEGQSDDSDDSFDSVEEEEQMLALRGLCGFGSDSDGDTTDSIDDTDHDNLVRFGIEQTDEQVRKTAKQRKVKRRSSSDTAMSASGPVLGNFNALTPSGSAVIETAEVCAEPVMSPFSVKKYRVMRNKAASDSQSTRRRTGSIASSSQQSTVSAPGIIEQDGRSSPSPITDIPEEEEEVYMDLDLDDILDLDSALHAEFEMQLGDWEEPETDNDTITMSDLTRWNRIPIGAYRKSRSPPKGGALMLQAMQGGEGDVLAGNGQLYLPMASLFSKRETVTFRVPSQFGRKRKITRQEAIGLSPMMCPIKPVPSSMKSRRAKRADRKAVKKSHTVSGSVSEPGTSPEKSGAHVPDNEVPLLDLPGASTPFAVPASSAGAGEESLPIPTLPSAECMPLNSPLFAAVRTQPSPRLLPSI